MIRNTDIGEYINDIYLKFNRIMSSYIDRSTAGVSISEDQSIKYTFTFYLLPKIQEKLDGIYIFSNGTDYIKESLDSNGKRCIIMYIPRNPTFNELMEYDYTVLEYCSRFVTVMSMINQTTSVSNGKIYAVDIMDEVTRILENKFENGNRNSSHFKDHTITTLYTTEERFDLTKMIFPYTTVMKMTYGVLFIFDYPNEIPSETLNEFGKILFI